MKDFVPFLTAEEIKSKIIPQMKACSGASEVFVRDAVAQSLLSLSSYIGRTATEDLIIPVFAQLLKDESPEVRMSICRSLGTLGNVIPLEYLSNLVLPVFQELASDKNWRMRLQAMDTFYLLATFMTDSFLKQPVSIKFLNEWLGDKYFAVREGAVDLVYRLSKSLGTHFMEKTSLPILLSFQNNNNYLYRLTVLFGLSVTPFISS